MFQGCTVSCIEGYSAAGRRQKIRIVHPAAPSAASVGRGPLCLNVGAIANGEALLFSTTGFPNSRLLDIMPASGNQSTLAKLLECRLLKLGAWHGVVSIPSTSAVEGSPSRPRGLFSVCAASSFSDMIRRRAGMRSRRRQLLVS